MVGGGVLEAFQFYPFSKNPTAHFVQACYYFGCLYPKSDNLTIRFFLGIRDILWTSSPKGANWSASHHLLVRPWSLIWTVEVSVEFKQVGPSSLVSELLLMASNIVLSLSNPHLCELLRDGPDQVSPQIGQFSGSAVQEGVPTTANQVLIKFHSDFSTSGFFVLRYHGKRHFDRRQVKSKLLDSPWFDRQCST